MHVLILTLGSRGDVQPYVALGRALTARGHRVTLSTGRGFESMIEAAGLATAPLSADVRTLLQRPDLRHALASVTAAGRAWREMQGLFRDQLEEMGEVARALRPDLILYHVKAAAAPHLGEALGVPAVPTFLIPGLVPTGAYPSPLLPLGSLGRWGNRLSHQALLDLARLTVARELRQWRSRHLGLPGPGPGDPYAGWAPGSLQVPRLHGYSRHLLPEPDDWGPREQLTGYWFMRPDPDWQPPESLARFLAAGPPPVYVGFGSMPAEDAAQQTRAVVEALRAVGRRGILATGWGGLQAVPDSDRIHVLEAAPHDWLFPRCAAVVHHGGSGTTHEGLRWGRPTVICPLGVDQPFWGRRVAALGAGPAPLPQKRLSAPALAAALKAALTPDVATRAAALGEAIRAEPGAEAAAGLVEGLAAMPARRAG